MDQQAESTPPVSPVGFPNPQPGRADPEAYERSMAVQLRGLASVLTP
jgi:hypothetical protein